MHETSPLNHQTGKNTKHDWVCGLRSFLTRESCFIVFQMAPLEQPQVADRSDLSQRLDMPQVDLPPEESSVNLTQLVPELDLLGDKGKEKKDESDEEEVRMENGSFLKKL